MAEIRQGTVDSEPTVVGGTPRWVRPVVAIGVVVALGLLAWWILGHVNEDRATGRWERLAAIEGTHRDATARTWLDVPIRGEDSRAILEHIEKLEHFLAAEGDADPTLAAHVHALLANLELSLALGLADTPQAAEIPAHQAKAKEHLDTIAEKFPNAPINRDRFRPASAPSVTRLLLRVLEEDRAWDAAHGRKAVEPDADPVVLVRTDRGDLRLRMFSAASPELAASFLAHATKGDYDGTLFFEKRDDTDEAWVHGGDLKTKSDAAVVDPADDVRKKWGDPTPADPLPPQEGRNRITHAKGIVTSWHPHGDDEGEDTAQFMIVARASPRLDYEFAPFARVEETSIPTLDRIFATPLHARKPEGGDARLADQLATPVRIVKVLVYDKGALRAGEESRASESEKRLEAVKVDEYKTEPAKPPAPPAPPAPTGGGNPPGTPPATPPAVPSPTPSTPPTPPATPQPSAK